MSRIKDETYDDKEAHARFEAALKGALSTPPKPLKDKPKVTRRRHAKKSKAKKKI